MKYSEDKKDEGRITTEEGEKEKGTRRKNNSEKCTKCEQKSEKP